MKISKPSFQKYLLVCENERVSGECSCGEAGKKIREKLKALVAERGLAAKIRVSRSGCLDVCGEGPNVLLMPDEVWFQGVEENDVEAILKKAAQGF